MAKTRSFNYANDEDFAEVLAGYGGEEFLKESFPNTLQMLHNTRKWHGSSQKQGLRFESENAMPDSNGFQNSFTITALPINGMVAQSTGLKMESGSVPGLFANSKMSLVEDSSVLIVSGEITDPVNSVRLGSFAVFDQDTNTLENSSFIDQSHLTYSETPHVRLVTEFKAFGDVDGQSVCIVHETGNKNIDISNISNVVEKINVIQPAPRTPNAPDIRITYNKRQDPMAAYRFPRATEREERAGEWYVRVFYPFLIEVELNDLFEFVPDNPVRFESGLDIILSSGDASVIGGGVHFNTAKWSNIKATVEGKKLTFDFRYSENTEDNYWFVEMPLSVAIAEALFDFHLSFPINYRLKNTTDVLTTSCIVSSRDLAPSPNLAKIKKSEIWWGCLGKDTIVRTASASKKISELSVGEELFTDKGNIKLKNIIVGSEEQIIALSVDDDSILLITRQHPIATKRGVIHAGDVRVGDCIMVEDGSYKPLLYFELIAYNDKVYSLELEKPALISAGGMMVGDYQTKVFVQQSEIAPPAPIKPELRNELEKLVTLNAEKFSAEVNV